MVLEVDLANRTPEQHNVLRLRLLGRFMLSRNNEAIAIASKKNRALLAILALSPNGIASRDRLCAMLWSNRSDDAARANLRQSIATLRKELNAASVELVHTKDDAVALDLKEIDVDALQLKQLAAGDREILQGAGTAEYEGLLLEDVQVHEEGYEQWLTTERQHFCDFTITFLERLTLLETGATKILCAKRLVEVDPLREASHRSLIKAYIDCGETALANRAIQRCDEIMKAEFGVAASADTLSLRSLFKPAMPVDNVHEPSGPKTNAKSEELDGKDSRNLDKGLSPAAHENGKRSKGLSGAFIGLAMLLVIGGGLIAYLKIFQEQQLGARIPTVAVMPFSAVGEATYLGDGIADDLISMLARSPELKVLSRSSSFSQRQAGDPRAVGQRLQADYLLEGNVRSLGKDLALTIHLTDVHSGQDAWSDEFPLKGPDILVSERQIAELVVARLVGETGEVQKSGYIASANSSNFSLDEYDYYLRGQQTFNVALSNIGTDEDFETAARIWREGLNKYPDSPLLKVKLGFYHLYQVLNFTSKDYAADTAKAVELAQDAKDGAGSDPSASLLVSKLAHWLLARAYSAQGRSTEAIAEAEYAFKLAPYDANMLGSLSATMIENGKVERGLEWLEVAALRKPGSEDLYEYRRGWALTVLGKSEEAISHLQRSNTPWTDIPLLLAINYVRTSQMPKAQAEVSRALTLDPQITLSAWKSGYFYSDKAIMQNQLSALAAAGLKD